MTALPRYLFITTSNGVRKRWKVVWLPKGHSMLEGSRGMIEAPTVKGKRVFLEMGQEPHMLFDTLVHEMAHAAGWNLSESWVHQFAEDVTTNMRRLGYEFKAVR